MRVMGSRSAKKAKTKLGFLLKQPRIIEGLMGESIEKVAKRLGVSHETVIREYLDISKEAKEGKNLDMRFKSNKEIAAIIGTYDEVKKIDGGNGKYIPGKRTPELVGYTDVDLEAEEKLLTEANG